MLLARIKMGDCLRNHPLTTIHFIIFSTGHKTMIYADDTIQHECEAIQKRRERSIFPRRNIKKQISLSLISLII